MLRSVFINLHLMDTPSLTTMFIDLQRQSQTRTYQAPDAEGFGKGTLRLLSRALTKEDV